jgi:dihydrofolate synthase / folylpolyglutamate synthase
LVVLAAHQLRQQGFTLTWQHIKHGLLKINWPGRMERVLTHPLVILDGAHNPAAMQALVQELKIWNKNKKVYLILGMMKDKDIAATAKILKGLPEKIWTITPPDERGLLARDLAKIMQQQGMRAEPATSYRQAWQSALTAAGKSDVVVVAGSLYNIAPARKALKGALRCLKLEIG